LVPVRDAAWAGSVIDGIGFAVTGLALGLAVCRLARRRGSVWATVGAVATTLGGIVFACGSVAFAVLMWFATSPDLVPVPTGTALLEHVAGHPGHLFVLQMSGFIGYSIGVLVLAVALWRSGSVPRWLPTVLGLLTVALFAGVEGRALDVVEAAQNAMLLGVAWYLWRTCGARSGSRTSPADAVG
ncbi:MAG TPA: hypothetical protein VHN80_26350, partial [Kineosporiaceae bacterium]|nr:hypothetical protein [Kineosporiaceae bacterium]